MKMNSKRQTQSSVVGHVASSTWENTSDARKRAVKIQIQSVNFISARGLSWQCSPGCKTVEAKPRRQKGHTISARGVRHVKQTLTIRIVRKISGTLEAGATC